MQSRAQRYRFLAALGVVLLGAFVLYLSSVANGPDFDLSFTRDVPSPVAPATLDRALSSVGHWPEWFFQTDKVVRVGEDPMRPLHAGSKVRFFLNAHRGPWTHFQVLAEVTSYVPQKKLSLRILEDSKGKLTRLFDRLEWSIELLPPQAGFPTGRSGPMRTLIRGKATAHTHNWRARLFGRIAERILMNQVFYANLFKLSRFTLPEKSSLELTPPQR